MIFAEISWFAYTETKSITDPESAECLRQFPT